MSRFFPVLLASVAVLSACYSGTPPEMPPQAATESSSEGSLKLYVFDCGMLRFDTVEMFSIAEDETDVRDLIVPCYMIEHPDGRLLWDGGLPTSTADIEGWHLVDELNSRLDKPFAEQLAELDLSMSSFDFAAFSHMHFDHVGVANELEGATLIIQKPEYDAAFADPVTVPFFDPSLYDNLKSAQKLIIEGDHDVFGDGSVRVISAPGHTPGHQVLFIDLPKTGPIVLSGDLYHFQISRDKRLTPQFNFDAEATLKSMDKVEAFLVEQNATLWIEHDLAAFEALKKPPEYYE